jgi:glycosyltransferase involved in cell wall biosynthesis
MSQEEVSSALGDADCLVLPSLSEPWGLVANEALCVGLPILVSNRCGCAEDLATPDTGWVFAAEDVGDLAEKMTEICRVPRMKLLEMGEAAVKKAQEYTPEAAARRIYQHIGDFMRRDTK